MQSNNKKPVVVGIGELLWDMLPTGKKAGGAPINFVYHASRLAGGAYSTIYTANEESTLQTPEVQVADTVGAGDAFSGALVISLLKGASLREAHEFAVRTAAYVCTKEGAWPAYEE